jgi:hypothetical protein
MIDRSDERWIVDDVCNPFPDPRLRAWPLYLFAQPARDVYAAHTRVLFDQDCAERTADPPRP